jgi:hypothetical protein
VGFAAAGWLAATRKRITPKRRVTDVTFARSFYDSGSLARPRTQEKGAPADLPAPLYPKNCELLHMRHVPDHAAAFALFVAGGCVHAEIIERLALIGPLLRAVIAGDDFPIAHVLV